MAISYKSEPYYNASRFYNVKIFKQLEKRLTRTVQAIFVWGYAEAML